MRGSAQLITYCIESYLQSPFILTCWEMDMMCGCIMFFIYSTFYPFGITRLSCRQYQFSLRSFLSVFLPNLTSFSYPSFNCGIGFLQVGLPSTKCSEHTQLFQGIFGLFSALTQARLLSVSFDKKVKSIQWGWYVKESHFWGYKHETWSDVVHGHTNVFRSGATFFYGCGKMAAVFQNGRQSAYVSIWKRARWCNRTILYFKISFICQNKS